MITGKLNYIRSNFYNNFKIWQIYKIQIHIMIFK
jgi:hypothetical protein